MMWKPTIVMLIVACSLMACKKDSGQDSQAADKNPIVIAQKQPAPEGLMVTPPNYAPEVLNATAQTYRSPIKYQIVQPQRVIYFDKNAKLIENQKDAVYSRQLLGKTAQGNWVAQDFYANGAAQTSPFMLRSDANVENFDASMTEGLVLFFQENGSLKGVAEWHNGKLFGVHSFYENKQLIAQMSDENGGTVWVLYPDGTVKAIVKQSPNEMILFRSDGSSLSQMTKKAESLTLALWHSDGRSVDEKDSQIQELRAGSEKMTREVVALMKTLAQ